MTDPVTLPRPSGRRSASRALVEETPVAVRDTGLPLSHPAAWLTLLVAAVGVLLSVSFRIGDAEFWQHLAIGKAIWQLHKVPTTHQWSWPTYGAPEVNGSWGFQALLWPVWKALGVHGLFLWRWITTLLAFGFLWSAARRLGARGLTSCVVAVLVSLVYRERAQIRPETLAAVLLALQIWILERRRSGGPDWSVALVPIAWAWANTHLSWFLGFKVIAAYLVSDLYVRWRHGSGAGTIAPRTGRLALVALTALAISFVNPFGWRALWQPFDFFLHSRDEPIFRSIVELGPFSWSDHWRSPSAFLLAAWPLLLAFRIARAGVDAAEITLCATFTWLALTMQRFTGFHALVALPFVARDLDALVKAVPWPAWTRPIGTRATLACAACVALGFGEWTRVDAPLGVSIDPKRIPAKACDFIEAHGLAGPAFNHSQLGGYMAYRFWPNRERLPFMDAQQAGTRQDREWYARVFMDPQGWPVVDKTYHFDYVLLDASQPRNQSDWLKDKLDSDTTWALVFLDDAAALYARRSGSFAPMARRFEYLAVPGGEARLEMLGEGTERDTMLRQLTRMELVRQIQASPCNARAHSMLANIDIASGDFNAAQRELREALRQDPLTFAAHERLGMMALAAGRPRDAVQEFKTEKRLTGGTTELPKRLAQAAAIAKGGPPAGPGNP